MWWISITYRFPVLGNACTSIRRYAAGDTVSCTLIPIPKGKNANVTDLSNYRGIALSSVFGKIVDLIFWTCLVTVCLLLHSSLVLRPSTLRLCALWRWKKFLHITQWMAVLHFAPYLMLQAFDRVDYCKPFSKLMSRNILPTYLRLLLNMYTNSVARVSWNSIFSQSFKVENGVRQGGTINPVLFCVYINASLQQLHNSGVNWLLHWYGICWSSRICRWCCTTCPDS